MKYIEPMDYVKFADYLLTKKIGDTVEFATDNSDVTEGVNRTNIHMEIGTLHN